MTAAALRLARTLTLAAAAAALLLAPAAASGQVRYPARIAEREFVLDAANLITAADEAHLRAVCDALLTEKKIPIIVVTIPSLGDYGADGWTIERYAYNLFDEWGIGFADYNYGVLLLVAKGDRRARIELGAGWGRDHDAAAQAIMDDLIIPRFKRGEFSLGIAQGVEGLDRMARGEAPPSRPLGERARSIWDKVVAVVGGLGRGLLYLIVFPLVIISRIFGWGGSSDGSGGGSWGGGSFGGGSSGGGGASGSW